MFTRREFLSHSGRALVCVAGTTALAGCGGGSSSHSGTSGTGTGTSSSSSATFDPSTVSVATSSDGLPINPIVQIANVNQTNLIFYGIKNTNGLTTRLCQSIAWSASPSQTVTTWFDTSGRPVILASEPGGGYLALTYESATQVFFTYTTVQTLWSEARL